MTPRCRPSASEYMRLHCIFRATRFKSHTRIEAKMPDGFLDLAPPESILDMNKDRIVAFSRLTPENHTALALHDQHSAH